MSDKRLDFIFRRRSIRRYQGEPVGDEDITALLEAAMAAPSANNRQPWHFVVVTRRDLLDKLAKVHNYTRLIKGAPLCIAVCGDPVFKGKQSSMWSQDCAAATENILLAAAGLGLGSVWMGIYPRKDQMQRVREILGIPEGIAPFSLIAIGHPAEKKEARTQYDKKKIHREQW